MVKRDYTRDYQDRAARVQISYDQSIKVDENGTYNVWYSKYSMDGSKFNSQPKKAEYRCMVARDAGRTRATTKSSFCVHFSHGRCTRGKDCTFLHRIPITGDRIETMYDCFGRAKHRNDREDMGGIGSFERRCRTLYIGGIAESDHIEEIVTAHFSEWGELEYVNAINDKGCAFVKYKSILNAEFAKEAMQLQALESDDVINVRWASSDPNPGVQEAHKRKVEEEVIETIKAQLPIVGPKGTILDYDESLNLTKKQKKDQMEIPPNPDDQDNWEAYCMQYHDYYGYYPGQDPKNLDSKETNESYLINKPKAAIVADYASDSD